jgi:hypothetical protein
MLWDGIALLFFILQFKFATAFAIVKAHLAFYSNCRKMLKKQSKVKGFTSYYNEANLPFRYFILKKRNLL